MAARRVVAIRPGGDGRAAKLLAEGWVRQTTIGEPRLSELVESYRALGYEVEVIEHDVRGDACGTCFEAGGEMGKRYGDIYLRKRGEGRPLEDELF